MKFRFLAAARREVDEATDYYADRASPRIAEAFLDDLAASITRVTERPEMGVVASARLRKFHLKHFPYFLVYRATPDEVVVHAVAHERRRPGYWQGRR